MYSPGCESDDTESYDEVAVEKSFKNSSKELMDGYQFLKFFIKYSSKKIQ